MKQTAVEWLVEKLAAIRKQNSGYRNIEIELKELIEQAKEMEKEQIIDAFEHVDFNLDDGLHYYEKIFKSE